MWMPGKKGRALTKSNMLLGVKMYLFSFLNVRPFSFGGFFTFLVALSHGAPPPPLQFLSLTGYRVGYGLVLSRTINSFSPLEN